MGGVAIPSDWPTGRYPAGATAARTTAAGIRQLLHSGRWYAVVFPGRPCAICGATFFCSTKETRRDCCGPECGMEKKRRVARAAVGAANPNWKGGVSTDNMRYRDRQLERWPERERARSLTRNAIKRGELVRQPCEKCGASGSVLIERVSVEMMTERRRGAPAWWDPWVGRWDVITAVDGRWACDGARTDYFEDARGITEVRGAEPVGG